MSTYRTYDDPDGHDDRRDPAEPEQPQNPFVTPNEYALLHSIDHECEQHDWYWVMLHYVVEPSQLKEARKLVKRMRRAGLLELRRGGVDDDGNICGGSGYGLTAAGKTALAWKPQAELKR